MNNFSFTLREAQREMLSAKKTRQKNPKLGECELR
jgi:hypothetical protein